MGISWSSSEDLICIQDDGTVLIYDIFGVFKRTVGMGQEAKEMRIIDCKTFTTEHVSVPESFCPCSRPQTR